jgi:DNA-binding transcriptional LysR family regulator
LDVRQLRYVVALVELRNFHRAAESLGVTQSALTKSVQQMERELGVVLFDRRAGRQVEPTEFGRIVEATAREVIGALESMSRTIRETVNLERGSVSIGAGAYVAGVWLGPVSSRVMRAHPRLRLEVHVDHWSALPELLRSGRVDFFVANVEHVLGQASEIRVLAFPPLEAIWVCRRGHPLAGAPGPLSRSRLNEYPLVGPPVPASIQHWMNAGAVRQSPTWADRKIDMTSVSMLKSMLRHSDAVSLVYPPMVSSELASGELVVLPFDAPPVPFLTGVAWLASRGLSPAAVAFVRELLVEVGVDPATAELG